VRHRLKKTPVARSQSWLDETGEGMNRADGCDMVANARPFLDRNLAAAFTAAWLVGLVTQRLGLSPIVGYLLAGILVGPHTPGSSATCTLPSNWRKSASFF